MLNLVIMANNNGNTEMCDQTLEDFKIWSTVALKIFLSPEINLQMHLLTHWLLCLFDFLIMYSDCFIYIYIYQQSA